MAEITNPQVVAFSNARIRPACDDMYSLYYKCKALVADYTAANIGSLINAAGDGNLVDDGSATDGRTRITGGDIYNVLTWAQQIVNFVENQAVTTADRASVISKPHVNSL